MQNFNLKGYKLFHFERKAIFGQKVSSKTWKETRNILVLNFHYRQGFLEKY